MRRKSKNSNNEKSEGKNNKIKQDSSIFGFIENLSKAKQIMSSNINKAWKQLQNGINSVKVREPAKSNATQQKQSKENNQLIIDIDMGKMNKKNSNQKQQSQKQQSVKTFKQSEASKFRVRTKSQNSNQLKSLRKTNQIGQSKAKEEQKKAERIKQINKRKLELMQRLRKIDAELVTVKKQLSPKHLQQSNKMERDLYSSSLNKSFIKLANSRLGKQANQYSAAEHHSKALQLLSKLNSDKLKRQQKLAQEFRKKQNAQILKLQQLQNKKQYELQMRKKNYQSSKYEKKMKSGTITINETGKHFKLNQFEEQQPDNQSSLIPTTMLQKEKSSLQKDELHTFDKLVSHKKSDQHLLTQRNTTEKDFDFNEQPITEIKNQQRVKNQVNQEHFVKRNSQQNKQNKALQHENQIKVDLEQQTRNIYKLENKRIQKENPQHNNQIYSYAEMEDGDILIQ